MFFDMGPLEMLAVFVIAVVVLGPEKLPKAISDVSALIRKFRAFSDSAQADIRTELGPEFSDLRLSDLHPRALAEKALSKAEDEAGLREFAAAFGLEEPADAEGSRPPPTLAEPAQAQPLEPRTGTPGG
ncbi:Sec-independent protein translocase TatB [Streptomyces sp. NBC_01800]|uniref:Sec-independent protein translocase TatB n=1 Tax=Streptomyces sp. NBC_01800 TaxID=2975945 RepID=UPI002DD9490B|nr:Sec-independent protein translocase TatB [Streptomyces sp. NBC_01800]WSA65740.1 Sec-independent protein translocase TatB [Streptomyces sp. NBC_01800]WSA73377.1 Sec-independent protein translocase TatB [Streptomyces sp. NBC_01800]